MIPVFTEDVRWVSSANDVMEAGDACCNGFASAMVGEGIVALVKFGVGDRDRVHHGFIVSKHEGRAINGNSQVA